MKTIALLKDYGIADAGNETKITNILDQVHAHDEKEITLSLIHCIIDYPATSMLIDKLLVDLTAQTGHKQMTIEVSYLLPEATLLNDLLGDSRFFSIEAKKEIPLHELQELINQKLNPEHILMHIIIMDRAGQIRQQYHYGSN